LSPEDSRLLFERIGVKGDQEEIDGVIEEYKGHALSLTLLAKYLVEDFKGDIKRAREIPPFHSDKEAGGKAHRILLWYEKQLSEAQRSFMKIFSLFRRAVNERDFEGVFRSEIETSTNKPLRNMNLFSFKRMVDNLCDRRLITKGQDDTYTAHPLIKNYFESIFEEEDNRLCHKSIYHYIGSYAPERPETLEEMQPLFEQVYHGCGANLHEEAYYNVYRQKIMRWDERFLVSNLGGWETNLNVIRNFFPKGDFQRNPFVSKIKEKSYLINEAGLSMMSIGRLDEVEGFYKKSIELDISQRDWAFASTTYINLVSFQILTGKLLEAKKSSKMAIRLSRKEKHTNYEHHSTIRLAYTLFLLGDINKASIEFNRVNKFQKKLIGLIH
jgi:tetratricopeptide (TPR) repeat protein